MRLSRPLSMLILPLFLLACEPVQIPVEPMPPMPDPAADACGASGLQDLVGQPSSVIAAMTFIAPMRLIRPGMAVTMDYSAERLNITLDEAEMITAVTCG